MNKSDLEARGILDECKFSAGRGGGPGGQNVNKVNTRVELRFNVMNSLILSDEEKVQILNKLRNRINKKGELILSSQAERSQLQNKNRVSARFINLVFKSLIIEKERISTDPTPSSRLKRVANKKKQAEKKMRRITPEQEE